MTERLFDQDAYCKTFSAHVLSCRAQNDGYAILLDRTAFYPEGGGQQGDSGMMKLQIEEGEAEGEVRCLKINDTQEVDGEIWHLADAPVKEGEIVEGEIDWEKRFDRMQNHTGEHIVSGLIHTAYGYDNVGFHMGAEYITIDLSGELSMQQLEEIEHRANKVIWDNVRILIEACSEEEAAKREFRSKKELHGTVRIVTIPGADVCACCGTHVKNTGEIGLIRILSSEKFRGGSRVEMICGKRSYLYDSAVVAQNRIVSVALSANPLETGEAVRRTKENLSAQTYRSIGLMHKLFALTAQKLSQAGDVLILSEPMAPDDVRRLAVAVMEECGGICAVFAGDDQEGYKYAIGQEKGDLRSFVKEMNAALKGRGGGKPFFAQGSVRSDAASIQEYFHAHTGRTWSIHVF